MPTKRTNSNRGDRIASKVQTLVAEILRDNFSDDAVLSGVSLVGAVAHGGLQFVKLFTIRAIPMSHWCKSVWMMSQKWCGLNWRRDCHKNMFQKLNSNMMIRWNAHNALTIC